MCYVIMTLSLLACSLSIAAKKQKDLFADIPHSVAEYDDAKKFKGCRLTEVESGSIYERLGIQVGNLVQPEGSSSNHKMEMTNTLQSSESTVWESTH